MITHRFKFGGGGGGTGSPANIKQKRGGRFHEK